MIWVMVWFAFASWLLIVVGKSPKPSRSKPARAVPSTVILPALTVLVLTLLDVPPRWALLVVIVAGTSVSLAKSWSLRRLQTARANEVLGACQALASMVAAGMHPNLALRRVALDFDVFATAGAAVSVGAPVDQTLRTVANQPGYETLHELAAAWLLAERTGAPLAQTALGIVEKLRDELQSQQEINAELTGPRATGKLLAALPVVGILLGYVAGGDPVSFLLGTSLGQWALVVAVVLTCLGLLWTEHLAGRTG